MIVGDVIDFECAAVDVAQHEVGRARCMYRGNARELPIQSDRADEGGASDLIVIDVVHFQPAGPAVAQQEIGFAGGAAEIADARELPIQTHRADEGSIGDLIAVDVVDLHPPVLELRKIMSLVPRLLKLPTPENCQFKPTVPIKAAPAI